MANENDAPKRFRSPPYPGLSLAKAIERAKQLYSKAAHHAVGVSVLADAWAYAPKSSGLWATAAGLGQYGFLFAEGSGEKRKFQLTDAAIRIVRDADPTSQKRQIAVQRAALLPPIHRELWQKFATAAQVSDVVLRNYLTLDRADEGKSPFSDSSAEEVIRSYKETIVFAAIGQSDKLPGVDEDKQVDTDEGPSSENAIVEEEGVREKSTDVAPKRREVRVMDGERELTTGLLSKDASFRLIVSGQIGVKEIDRLIAKLQIDKEILAEPDDDEDAEGKPQ